jgi:hypothetical protein
MQEFWVRSGEAALRKSVQHSRWYAASKPTRSGSARDADETEEEEPEEEAGED